MGRRNSIVLAKALLRYMDLYSERWYCNKDNNNIIGWRGSAISIQVIPRRLRIFDGIRVLYKGTDVWIPLRLRLKLRRSVRSVLAEKAINTLSGSAPTGV